MAVDCLRSRNRGVAPQARRPGVGGPALVATSQRVSRWRGAPRRRVRPAPGAADPGTGSAKYDRCRASCRHESFDTDRVLVGTAANPALTTEGDAVSVGGVGSGCGTHHGPQVPRCPGEGPPTSRRPLPARGPSRCRYRLVRGERLDGRTSRPSTTSGPFTSLRSYRVGPDPPEVVAPHKTVTFELRAVMVVGEGLMVWSPDGNHPVAKWDFEVEND